MKNDPQEPQEDHVSDRLGWIKRTWHRKFNWLTAVKRGIVGYQHQSKHINRFGIRTTKKYADNRQKATHNRLDRKIRKGGKVNRKFHRKYGNDK